MLHQNTADFAQDRFRSDSGVLSERILLGSVLRNPGAAEEVVHLLAPSDFYADAHQRIYGAIVNVCQAGKPADMEAVARALTLANSVQEIGGYQYLAELFDNSWVGADVVRYAASVRESSVHRQIHALGHQLISRAELPTGPAKELLEWAEKQLYALGEIGVSGSAAHLSDGLQLALTAINARTQQVANATGIETGLADLDELLAGLQPGSLVIVAARPSMGKTAFALAMIRNIASRGTPVFFASLEQALCEVGERLLVAESGVDGQKVRRGLCDDHELERIFQAVIPLRDLPVHIDPSPAQTVLRIASNARRLKRKKQLGLVVIDYLQLIEPENRRVPRHEQVAGISTRLKQLARELEVPVVTLAQLNRAVENRSDGTPRLSDLRESGQIEADADVVLLLHRDPEESTLDGKLEIHVAKQRNGPTGEIRVRFDRSRMRIEDLAVGGV